jgi:hypothetical protein
MANYATLNNSATSRRLLLLATHRASASLGNLAAVPAVRLWFQTAGARDGRILGSPSRAPLKFVHVFENAKRASVTSFDVVEAFAEPASVSSSAVGITEARKRFGQTAVGVSDWRANPCLSAGGLASDETFRKYAAGASATKSDSRDHAHSKERRQCRQLSDHKNRLRLGRRPCL